MAWRPFDFVVALLALALTFLLIFPLTATILEGVPQTEAGMELLDKLSTAAMSIVGLYVGAMIQRKRDDEERLKREREER